MREALPNYRAWSKKFGGMIYSTGTEHTIDVTGCAVWDASASIDDEGCPIMWGSALKDKEGVEIFEGDILLFTESKRDDVGYVDFYDGAFVVRSWKDKIRIPHLTTNIAAMAKVMGNIHKNKRFTTHGTL
jgi:uncharacterized phage protein (TIGR01671 family)